MQALCYECGETKSSPLKLCSQCQAIPQSKSEQILSLCLSLECVKAETLVNCRKYFRKKNRAPRFRDNVIQLATMLLEEQSSNSHSNQSIEFSSGLFDFADLATDEPRFSIETITANIIGRGKKQDDDNASVSLGNSSGTKTSHQAQWVVGKDISDEQYQANKNHAGEIHVWYRWINNNWTWKCIPKSQYDQLKAVELGQG